MANKPLPTPAELRQLLEYDPETGRFTHKARQARHFAAAKNPQRAANSWNKRFAGKQTFTAGFRGYRIGGLLGTQCYAHRVAWAYMTGEWPAVEIDHINGDPSDNCFANLRSVSKSENGRNKGIGRRNKSGVMGVIWCKTIGKWRATIRADNRQIHLGTFDDLSEAAKVRREAEARFGFHPNHGQRPSCT